MISTKDTNAGLERAPSNGTYVGADGLPHFVRAGDPIPEGHRFVGEGGDVAGTARQLAQEASQPASDGEQGAGVAEGAAKKTANTRGPKETTEAAGPKETA